jgi:tight adherence protein B
MNIALAAFVFILVLTVSLVVSKNFVSSNSNRRRTKFLKELAVDTGSADKIKVSDTPQVYHRSVYDVSTSPFLNRMADSLPFMQQIHSMILQAGLNVSAFFVVSATAIICVIFMMLVSALGFGITGMIICVVLAIYLPRVWLKSRIRSRNDKFINQFPDAIDMIVRSVKSGHPLNAALRMIAENSEPPVSTEFKRVVDEISYGRSLTDALYRLSERIEATDVNFFVVVLAVQQETGGNLAEVLGNLSNVLRKRRQLKMKIKAITSEARMTAWILGSLPFVMLGALHLFAPGYLDPLFEEKIGNIILGISISMVAVCMVIVRKMIQIDI